MIMQKKKKEMHEKDFRTINRPCIPCLAFGFKEKHQAQPQRNQFARFLIITISKEIKIPWRQGQKEVTVETMETLAPSDTNVGTKH